jgi:hypothetical protein
MNADGSCSLASRRLAATIPNATKARTCSKV